MYPRIQSSKICFAHELRAEIGVNIGEGKKKTKPVSRAGERQTSPEKVKNTILFFHIRRRWKSSRVPGLDCRLPTAVETLLIVGLEQD